MGEAPLCSCGTYAIGVCAMCGQPVCGDCSELVAGKRTCRRHRIEAHQDAARQREEEKAARAAPLHQIGDPIERLLRGLLLLEKLYGKRTFQGGWGGRTSLPDEPDFVRACSAALKLLGDPERAKASRGEMVNAAQVGNVNRWVTWDDQAVGRWFVKRVKQPPDVTVPIQEQRAAAFGRTKVVTIDTLPAWTIRGARSFRGDGGSGSWDADVLILADGRVIAGVWHTGLNAWARKNTPWRVDNSAPRIPVPDHFDVAGLLAVARRLGLEPPSQTEV